MIEVIVITALFCNGLQVVTGKGMVLHFIRRILEKIFISIKWNEAMQTYDTIILKAYYPILYCIKCMPSIYGTCLSLLFLPFGTALIWQVPIVCISASALAYIISLYIPE